MKILIYSHYFAPSVGGVEVIVESLASGLASRASLTGKPEFDVTVVTNTPQGACPDQKFPFRVVRKPGIRELAGLIRESDLLHIAGPAFLPMALGKLLRKAIVVEHHGYQAICLNGELRQQPSGVVCPGHFQAKRFGKCLRCRQPDEPLLRSITALAITWLRYVMCRHRTKNVAITEHVLRRHRFPDMEVIYYGVDDLLIARPRDPVAPRPDSAAGLLRFAYVGRFVSEKGIPVLLDASRKVLAQGLKFELLLVGDGPERGGLEDRIRKNGLSENTRITGFLKASALETLLDTIQVVVMPSVWEETAGLSAIEQMMRGKLVIASEIGGLAEIVRGAGLLFPPGDAEALAGHMRDVVLQPSLVSEMGSIARGRARYLFNRDRMLLGHVDLYRQLAAGTD